MKTTNESLVTFHNGSNLMTETFRTQIYELLEQSKVVHPIKDKVRRKKVAMTKDLQQILSKNEKRVKEDKWDDEAKELRDLITKQQKRLKREKELGEDVKSGILLTNQKSFKVSNISYGLLNGLVSKMSAGRRVNTEIIANNIAIPVKTPK